ncbi:DUF6843 domain-containing protein [Fictibacillus halophilus]|uniref:DUF6843 domain-containing protein n=1 Tax=Fictibacillus halophilus TaxID=1610490 RepID=UPI003637993F
MKKKLSLLIIIAFLVGCVPFKEETTDNIFLIPEGFDGAILVFYNVPKESKFKKEDGFSVIPVELKVSEALAGTDMAVYGAAFTSESEKPGSLTVNDKYFYVNENGKRTKVKEGCASYSGGGGFSGDREGGITYEVTYITTTGCGESFYLNGKEKHDIQHNEVSKEWNSYFGD